MAVIPVAIAGAPYDVRIEPGLLKNAGHHSRPFLRKDRVAVITDEHVAAAWRGTVASVIHDEDGRRGAATSSLVSGGCIISGSRVDKSLLFTGVHAHSYSEVEHCVVLPYVNVNRGARVTKCVIDKGVVIPAGLVVGEDPELDASRFRRSEGGVCLITQDMIDRLQL